MAKRRRSSQDENLGEGEGVVPAEDPKESDGEMAKEIQKHEEEIRQPVPPPESKPVQKKAVVPYRVYEKVSGKKWDQLAGFKSHVKRKKLRPMSVKEWHEAYAKFMGQTVK